MQVRLLMDPDYTLFSTDAMPRSITPSSQILPPAQTDEEARNTECGQCSCQTQDVWCLCGERIGYRMVQPCQHCLNGQRWEGHSWFFSAHCVEAEPLFGPRGERLSWPCEEPLVEAVSPSPSKATPCRSPSLAATPEVAAKFLEMQAPNQQHQISFADAVAQATAPNTLKSPPSTGSQGWLYPTPPAGLPGAGAADQAQELEKRRFQLKEREEALSKYRDDLLRREQLVNNREKMLSAGPPPRAASKSQGGSPSPAGSVTAMQAECSQAEQLVKLLEEATSRRLQTREAALEKAAAAAASKFQSGSSSNNNSNSNNSSQSQSQSRSSDKSPGQRYLSFADAVVQATTSSPLLLESSPTRAACSQAVADSSSIEDLAELLERRHSQLEKRKEALKKERSELAKREQLLNSREQMLLARPSPPPPPARAPASSLLDSIDSLDEDIPVPTSYLLSGHPSQAEKVTRAMGQAWHFILGAICLAAWLVVAGPVSLSKKIAFAVRRGVSYGKLGAGSRATGMRQSQVKIKGCGGGAGVPPPPRSDSTYPTLLGRAQGWVGGGGGGGSYDYSAKGSWCYQAPVPAPPPTESWTESLRSLGCARRRSAVPYATTCGSMMSGGDAW